MDTASLLRSLNAHRVRYVVIGATAFPVHGYARATLDIDVFIEATPENAKRTLNRNQLLERITTNPRVMVGKPVIRGTRLTVEYILNLLARGATEAEILNEYQGLTHEDIQASLLFSTQ